MPGFSQTKSPPELLAVFPETVLSAISAWTPCR